MKIQIDLNEILQDEYGPVENLAESIRRQIVDSLAQEIRKDVTNRITAETSRVINEELQVQLHERMPTMIEEIFTQDYTVVGSYGQKGETTNFRNQLVKTIANEMVYKQKSYESEKNAFTKAVDEIISSNMKKFQAEFNEMVKDKFTKDAFTYAVTEMRKRLGLT